MNGIITLPPRTGGEPLEISASSGTVVIIGANGAGKTRFATRLGDDLGPKAFRLSALNGLFIRESAEDASEAIDTLYEAMAGSAPEWEHREASQLERLLSMLMHDELVNLVAYKVRRTEDPTAELLPSKLDCFIEVWQDIFPESRILTESGRMLFAKGLDPDAYSAIRLSAGERAVIYYISALLYAPADSVVMVDNPDIFLHPSIMQTVWNRLEQMRPDCLFVYTTHDLEFAGSRTGAATIWVRDFDAAARTWNYDLLPSSQGIPDEVYLAIIGSRKPIIFIEGDSERSIDAKLYPLIFKDYTVKSMGSCNKVIEATRSFNDLAAFHHLDSHGIVDRDRRDAGEVSYLRRKKIFVPEVAEIENILMLEEVIRTVATECGRSEDKIFNKVRHTILALFKTSMASQALQHTRHRVKRFMEYRTDGRFSDIDMLERHIRQITTELNPRGLYEKYMSEFGSYVRSGDYDAVLRVFNQKSMIPSSNVAELCGLRNKDEYILKILQILRTDSPAADRMRNAILKCFGLTPAGTPVEATVAPQPEKKKFFNKKSKPKYRHAKKQ